MTFTDLPDLPDLPRYLYKFITWEKEYHKRLVTENEIFFTSAKNFNDPFDSAIPLRYDLGTDEQIFELYKSHVEREHPNLTTSEIERVTRNEIKINNIKDPKTIESNIDRQRTWAYEKYGILSLTTEYENILMWSHYANSHKGICVRFNCERFRKFIENDCFRDNLIIVWKKVEYQSEYPLLIPYKLNDDDIVLKSLLIKSCNWDYENEYRFILFDYPDKSVIIPDGIIDQIILGCNIEDKNNLIEIAKLKNIELLQASIKKNSFGLDFTKINI